ncbi:uncharacterized protein PV09_07491 [Verruconis gallopava]|uniref:Uncharacterized protein n=1 Tax=Verruconis gallopava TaxID=253628 RepID=A0A0D2APB9_9PEZI|nr:uncharacterized protein PV09_07491 [Verruconis gallopava]KIW00969.1 hypothetical protein PV09_07491 [Verruconis gallopava]
MSLTETCMMASEPATISRKRKPSDDLTDQQRLAKRFDLLNIDNASGKLYIPVSPSLKPTTSVPNGTLDNDQMALDDTKHKVYIYDLDAELASDTESDTESKPIFIPDIEKHLNKLPKVVLVGDEAHEAAKNMQMVLYTVPTSLTIPEENDSVRKAILESRQRMRDRQALRVPDMPVPTEAMPPLKPSSGPDGEHVRSHAFGSTGNSSEGAIQVPATPLESFAQKAAVNGYANTGYDPDIMEMD